MYTLGYTEYPWQVIYSRGKHLHAASIQMYAIYTVHPAEVSLHRGKRGNLPPPLKLPRLRVYMYMIKQPTSMIF